MENISIIIIGFAVCVGKQPVVTGWRDADLSLKSRASRPPGYFLSWLIMSLKKFLKSEDKGQAIVEYFILLTILAVLTVLAGSTFLERVHNSTQNATIGAADKMVPRTIFDPAVPTYP